MLPLCLTLLAAPADPPAGGLYALCLGVSKTADPKLPPLTADRDADRLAAYLRAGDGFRQAVALTSGGADKATAAGIRKQLARFAADAGPADTVVFHFSGYEWQYPGEDGYYLVPADGTGGDKGSQLTLAEVYAAVGRSKAGVKLVLIDSCRGREGLKPNPALPPADPPAGVGTLWACSTGETALDTAADGGVFTHALLTGLKGPADADRDGAVTWDELSDYLARVVPPAARQAKEGHRQTPSRQGHPGPLRLPVRK